LLEKQKTKNKKQKTKNKKQKTKNKKQKTKNKKQKTKNKKQKGVSSTPPKFYGHVALRSSDLQTSASSSRAIPLHTDFFSFCLLRKKKVFFLKRLDQKVVYIEP
jgi:cobalamin-dependent methionine synthase I